MKLELLANGEDAMVELGAQIATALEGRGVVYLEGNLGMGKTTLSQVPARA